jgi:hypothetical protein
LLAWSEGNIRLTSAWVLLISSSEIEFP